MDALVQYIDPARTHFNKRCTSLTSDGDTTTVHFQDGTTAQADVVLGADGIKSVVRRYVTGTVDDAVDPHLRFSNMICYRSLIPMAKLVDAGSQTRYEIKPVCFMGQDRHIICFTVRGRTVVSMIKAGDNLRILMRLVAQYRSVRVRP